MSYKQHLFLTLFAALTLAGALGGMLLPVATAAAQPAQPVLAQATPVPTMPTLPRGTPPPSPLREGGPALYVLLGLPVVLLVAIIVAVRVHRASRT